MNNTTRRNIKTRIAGAIAIALGAYMLVIPQATAASTTCGEISLGFAGTRLLNDGISDSAGPFTVDIPAGTYNITMRSADNHPSADYQTDQTAEQWYFTLNNGYTSPLTPDIPNDQQTAVATINSVEIGHATTIAVHHARQGNINSVNVVCVGFTPTPPPATTTTAAPTTTVAPPETTIAAPATTIAAPATTIAAPATTATPPETTTTIQVLAPATTQPAKVFVNPAPAPELAITGPMERTLTITLTGILLIIAGMTLLALERHNTTELKA